MASDAAPKFGKGDRIRITQGPAEGVTGTIFWKGENKYGPGERYGVRGDDGETHWIDGASVEATDAAVPEGPTFERGDRVKFRVQGQEGTGTVFWTGQNRHGPGQRLGVNPDGADGRDDALWLDARAARPLSPDEDPQGGQADWAGDAARTPTVGAAGTPEAAVAATGRRPGRDSRRVPVNVRMDECRRPHPGTTAQPTWLRIPMTPTRARRWVVGLPGPPGAQRLFFTPCRVTPTSSRNRASTVVVCSGRLPVTSVDNVSDSLTM